MKKFIVLADARSGTHYFESIINQHPEIQCFHEIFSGFEPSYFFHFLLEKINVSNHNVHPSYWPDIFDSYLSNIYSQFLNHKAVGMDIKYYQTSWVFNLFEILKQHDVRIIHLMRKNILKHHIAWILHTQRNKLGRKFHETKKVTPVKLHINLQTLILELQNRRDKIEWYKRFLADSNLEHMEIYYEDCFDNPEQLSQTMTPFVFDQVYDFLNIDDIKYDLKTEYVKTNPALLCELVANYKEIVDLLTDTEWEYCLNDNIGENIKSAKELNHKGEVLANSGQKKEAIEIFLKAIEMEPNFAMAYNNIGVILFEACDYNKSLDFFEKAINIEKNPIFINNYNEVLAHRKNHGIANTTREVLDNKEHPGKG